jgi:hypothetical protein
VAKNEGRLIVFNKYRKLFKALIFGFVSGFAASLIFFFISPAVVISIKTQMPLQIVIRTFILNSILATLICYGGVLFSFAELKVYKHCNIYRMMDKIFNPLYEILGRFSKKYRKLGPMYRSCYLSLSVFPVSCIFLIAFIISLYFSVAFFSLGLSTSLLKLLPHILIEISVFVYSARIATNIAKNLENHILRRDAEKFRMEGRKILRNRYIWRKLAILYVILIVSAFIERFFVESSF